MDQILEKDKSIKSKAKFQILPKHAACLSFNYAHNGHKNTTYTAYSVWCIAVHFRQFVVNITIL